MASRIRERVRRYLAQQTRGKSKLPAPVIIMPGQPKPAEAKTGAGAPVIRVEFVEADAARAVDRASCAKAAR
jgi:hypothetical protein